MKIGLIRHYRVLKPLPDKKLVSGAELGRWFAEYEEADIELGTTALGDTRWSRCFSSDLPRAAKTAKHVFRGPVRFLPDLREIPAPEFGRWLKLPVPAWFVLIRASEWINRKSRRDIKEAKRRIARVLDEALSESEADTLIVSHAAMMVYLRKELIARGFKGPSFFVPENGRLYVFEKDNELEEK